MTKEPTIKTILGAILVEIRRVGLIIAQLNPGLGQQKALKPTPTPAPTLAPEPAPEPAPTQANLAQQRLDAWKKANPQLTLACGEASIVLGDIFNAYIRKLTSEIIDNADSLVDSDSDYMLNDFVDRFGNRALHLNGMVAILGQLGTTGVKV